jgi:hypothetical protein
VCVRGCVCVCVSEREMTSACVPHNLNSMYACV